MRSRNRKVKKQGSVSGSAGNYAGVSCGRCVGYGGCAGLLLLALVLMNPVAGNEARATEGGEAAADEVSYDGEVTATADEGTAAQADSGVTISFTPSSGSASLTPTTSAGSSAKINVSANVKIASTGGYTIYLGGKNAALTGSKTGQTIPAATSATTFANMATNTWGYAAAEGATVPDSATYSALPQGQGKSLASVSGNNTNIDRTFALSFATKIGNDKPADTYSNQVTLSVTSSPLQVTNEFSVDTMQGMTSTVCNNATDQNGDGEITGQLMDVRDGKYYWVNKLADGKCWMTQNLDLDLSASKALASSDSDVLSSWMPGYTTINTVSSSTIAASSYGRSWDLGDVRIVAPSNDTSCGRGLSDARSCERFTAQATPTSRDNDKNAHYILGNHYQFFVASGGTCTGKSCGTVTGSVCSRNWRLPSTSDFSELLSSSSLVFSDVDKIVSAPFYFVSGGAVIQDSNYFSDAGSYAWYWSNYSDGPITEVFSFGKAGTSAVTGDTGKQYGFSVRCIAR